MAGRVLIVDDEKNIRKTVEMIHGNAGWETASAESGAVALELLAADKFDIVYLDLAMPQRDGLEVLKDIKERWPDQLVVILTGNATIERAVEATRLGAFDFLEKDCGKEKILVTSRNALSHRSLAEENRRLRRKISTGREILGKSRGVQENLGQIAKVAPTNARVLILGESGTGKELIAHAIHDRSSRASGPFIKVNCAAIPEELIEAELFGSVKGAFTGAEAREGKFQAAHNGTLFLDEIGDMSLRVQTKVLRALQEGEIEKVGSNKTIKVDVRVIAATNKNLGEEVSAGRFREDLYFRLNVVPIEAPPLRGRVEDIPLLAAAFVKEYCEMNDLPHKTLDDRVVELLSHYPWPGNVRELRNQVERLVIMSPGQTVTESDLSSEIRLGKGFVGSPALPIPSAPSHMPARHSEQVDLSGRSLQEAKREFERTMILDALERHDWNVSRAATSLGLERTNLHKKIKQLELSKETK
jgi:two-component system nitrogen regulation response regulator NtrX